METPAHWLGVKVIAIEQLTPLIKRFTFERLNGQDFPAFAAGSHIFLKIKASDKSYSNTYSLMGGLTQLRYYQISVRLEENGEGGTKFLHDQIKVGDELEVSTPHNLFPLSDDPSCPHVLIAGGIGITPCMTHLEALHQRQVDYQLHYAFRAPEHGALVDDLCRSVHQPHCHYYIDSEQQSLHVPTLLASLSKQSHLYVCGPQSLLDEVIWEASEQGFAPEQVHYELFTAKVPQEANAFTVVLAQSGLEIDVAANQSILQAIEGHDFEVECLCREGVCGTCETTIVSGTAEHYDQYLDDEEKAAQKTMMICVSRARGPKIILDL